MNSLVTTMIAWLLFLSAQPQNPSVLEKQLLFEKQMVAEVQRIPASDLDAELPRLPFADWFKQIIGPGTGIVWQLGECSNQWEAAPDDLRACVEVNTILLDGRRVLMRVVVGTFKKWRIGSPAFSFGVIEQEGELYLVRRLRDLPRQLSAPPGSLTNGPAVKLPDAHIHKVRPIANSTPVALLVWSSQAATIEEPPPPPAAPWELQASPVEDLKILGSISWGGVINKVQPRYPMKAKKVNASGPVDVQITISAEGRVTEAKATSGHPLLREAAEEAARQWVFKPATLKGVPVETQIVLTFIFKAPK